jgi:hypothetical protein
MLQPTGFEIVMPVLLHPIVDGFFAEITSGFLAPNPLVTICFVLSLRVERALLLGTRHVIGIEIVHDSLIIEQSARDSTEKMMYSTLFLSERKFVSLLRREGSVSKFSGKDERGIGFQPVIVRGDRLKT